MAAEILRCAVLDDYQNVARVYGDWGAIADRVVVTVFNDHIDDRDHLIERLRDFEIISAMRERTRFDAALINALPKLKLLVTTGRYNHSIDMAACAARGIPVCGTNDVHGAAAELTWGLILSLLRHIPAEDRDFKMGGRWQPRLGHSLTHRKLGLLGFGRLGQRVARVAKAFGMEPLVWSKNITQARADAEGAKAVASLDELLRSADIVSIHLRLNGETRGLIGARELGLMKPTSFIVNTSRGPIIEEKAMIDALSDKRLAGAALDVFDREPLPADHPFRRIERLIGTPHVGFVTEETYRIFFHDAVENIAAWLKGAPVRLIEPRA
jgi:phosphoglycerate dehydrogenase-like enzyme